MNLFQELKEKNIIKPDGKLHVKFRKTLESQDELLEQVIKATSFLSDNSDLRERLYCISQGITTQPTCKKCGGNLNFRIDGKYRNTYPTFCGSKCFADNEEIRKKRNQTRKQFDKNKKQQIINKRNKTNIERYGCENPLGNKNIQQKGRRTRLQKYGYENLFNDPNIRDQIKQTNIERYGCENVLSNSMVRKKCEQTNIERYGVGNPFNSELFQEKRKQTMLKCYGVETPIHSPILKSKIHDTMNERYGNAHFWSSQISDKVLEQLNDENWLYDQHKIQQKPLTVICEELGVAHSTVWQYFKKHNISVTQYGISTAEKEIVKYIQSTGVEVIQNTRSIISPLELDIFLPQLNIAIEYNGIFWHSELNGKNKNYHLEKTKRCENKNIRLIHIFETEWCQKSDIVKSRLNNLLNQSTRLYARKCVIKEVPKQDKNAFLNDNHIQGTCASNINYGLYYNDRLVACMTFGKSRFSKKYEYELLRYATQQNYTVVGGASKLFKHFVTECKPKSIVSYSDKRWNTGNLYNQLGFSYLHTSKPNYFYFKLGKDQDLLSRQNFQKHKLSSKLETFDPNLTEWQNMQNNGYDRIWDCGNSVWVWKK